jgi:hypothetical protein
MKAQHCVLYELNILKKVWKFNFSNLLFLIFNFNSLSDTHTHTHIIKPPCSGPLHPTSRCYIIGEAISHLHSVPNDAFRFNLYARTYHIYYFTYLSSLIELDSTINNTKAHNRHYKNAYVIRYTNTALDREEGYIQYTQVS